MARLTGLPCCFHLSAWPRYAAYDASKAGLLGVTRALAIDHGPEGIRVMPFARDTFPLQDNRGN
jgi:enoyl-[acyl-carrier-protein] reductase (NADH)